LSINICPNTHCRSNKDRICGANIVIHDSIGRCVSFRIGETPTGLNTHSKQSRVSKNATS
jgi:hypothetical protein